MKGVCNCFLTHKTESYCCKISTKCRTTRRYISNISRETTSNYYITICICYLTPIIVGQRIFINNTTNKNFSSHCISCRMSITNNLFIFKFMINKKMKR